MAEPIEVGYTKNSSSRVIHGDGVWGGPTPQGDIYMAFFSEHATLPERIRLSPNLEAHRLEEQEPMSLARRGVTREIQTEVVVSLNFAIRLREWLDEKITVLQQIEAEAKSS